MSPKTQLGGASIDLRLGSEFIVHRKSKYTHVRFEKRNKKEAKDELEQNIQRFHIKPPPEDQVVLHPGEFALGSTLEYIKLPPDIVGILHGRSSWGRLGIIVHATAGFIDPGYSGNLTFELINDGRLPVPLYVGVRMAQMILFQLPSPSLFSYRGKYHRSIGTKVTSIFDDPEFDAIREAQTGRTSSR